MTASRLSQIATSAGIAAIAAVALAFGAQIALFNADVARIEAAAATAAPDPATRTQWVATEAGPAAPAHDTAATLGAWQATPGVGSTARVMIAAQIESSRAQRLLETTHALSIAPTNGAQWLAFADATMRLGYGAEHALLAYDMATLTARREPNGIYDRALLALRAWEQLPADRRQAAMAQLGELKRYLGKPEREAVAAAVKAKTPEVRAEIAAALVPKLGGDKKLVKALGL